MRETRPSGSVEGVMSNRDPYSDFTLGLKLSVGPEKPQNRRLGLDADLPAVR
jgi:hypothetical protein